MGGQAAGVLVGAAMHYALAGEYRQLARQWDAGVKAAQLRQRFAPTPDPDLPGHTSDCVCQAGAR